MSSPNSQNPNGLTNTMNTSPIKENDRSYDSRESVGDREPQPPKTTVKKATKTKAAKPEQSVPQNTEELVTEEANQPQKQVAANAQDTNEQEKKTKKKKAKKTEEKAVENTENVTQQNAVVQEEKQKKTKKKAGETEVNNQLAETKKVENVETAASNTNNTQSRAKSVKKTQKTEETPVATQTVQIVVKEAGRAEKTQEITVNVAADNRQQKTTKYEPENKKPQSKQDNRAKNLQVSEPAVSKSVLFNALVSPANQSGKPGAVNQKNIAATTPKGTDPEPRYSKNTFPTQQNEERPTAYSRGQSVNLQNAPTLKKSPTQGELSTASSPKSKLGPIKSKIQSGLNESRIASKKGDTSEINNTMTTQKVKSPTNAATRPKTSDKLNATQKSYILEKVDTTTPAHNTTHTDMKKKRIEKARMRSFDATKTDKIKADDSFETRSRMWQIRKAEKLLVQEKKKNRKELENCTFAPTTNQKLLPEELTASTIYERGVEWTEKVKTTVAVKSEEILQAAKTPEPKKPRVKSFNGPPEIRSTRVYVEGFTGPQFGVSKTVSVPTFSQDPLEFKGNLDAKVNEICNLYENLSSHLKKKSVLNQQSKSTLKEKPKSRTDEVKSAVASRSSLVSQKDRSVKVEPTSAGSNGNTVKGDEQRLASLRGILNMNAKAKNQNAAAKEKAVDQEQNSPDLPSELEDTSRVPQNSNQRVEIRNNRYVVVEDDNISAIEKDSNFEMSLNFDASTARQQLV